MSEPTMQYAVVATMDFGLGWLCGVIWVGDPDRADRHRTPHAAQAALDRAAQFMTDDVLRRAVVIEVE